MGHSPHEHDGAAGIGDERVHQLTHAADGVDHAEHGPRPSAGAGHEAHDKHAGHSVAMFRERFWLCLLLSVPVLFWSEMIQGWFGYTAPSFPLSARIPAIFGTVVFLYGGRPFLAGAVREARNRQPGMMMLISLAIVIAFAASVASEFRLLDLEFWWELVLLIDVMLLGHWQEMRAIGQASGALEALAVLLPDEAEVAHGEHVRTVPVSSVRVGDVVLVRSGARVPADGTIVEGEAAFDESMITGESRAVERRLGDRVVAGTVATDSAVRVRVEAVGGDTALAGIQRLVGEAQVSRSRAQSLADRAAAVLFYVAIVAGAVTFVAWTILGTVNEAIERTVTVLVIACPHALGLAIPLVVSISTGVAAKYGVLIKDRLALERMRSVDTVLFDKTGTLTKGTPAVRDVVGVTESDDEVLRLAGAAESSSEHPLGRAIVTAAERTGPVPAASSFRSMTGRGVAATVDDADIEVGGRALLRDRGLDEPPELAERTRTSRDRGATMLYVVGDGRVIGSIEAEDEIRRESVDAVRELHEDGVRSAMLTGDAEEVARTVAAEVGIDETIAEVLPQDKASEVLALQVEGREVAMVGDGVNDAPALARADVGIALGAGTDVAIESAGIVLASDDPRGVVSVRTLSKASYRKMVENLVWAIGYNVVAIPLAAGALAWAGIVLPPAAGALAMSLSTVIVAVNAMTLRRLDLSPEAQGRYRGGPMAPAKGGPSDRPEVRRPAHHDTTR